MKNYLTIILMSLSIVVMGQKVKVFFNQSLNVKKNIQSLGIQITNKDGLGFYVSGGLNILESSTGLNNHFQIGTQTTLSGQTWWFTTPQNHIGLNMTDYNQNGLWSSLQYNNQFIDNTTYRATVNTIFTENKVQHKLVNVGFVFPIRKKVFKVGVGLYNNTQNGTSTNVTTSTVKKINLYWETNLQSYHIIYTENSISEKVEKTPININKTVLNINLDVQLNKFFTVGYDSQVGINFGMVYNL